MHTHEIRRLFPKDPQLKCSKSKYKEEGNNEENIASNKEAEQSDQITNIVRYWMALA